MEEEKKERLQKVIAQKGFCSRRKAEELIEQGKVKVNGDIVTKMGMLVSLKDCIEIDGVLLKEKEVPCSFLFYKPKGVLSTALDDRGRKTVLDYFREEPIRLYPAGRLDQDTTGALILTNDGELSELITHPSGHLEKTYIATMKGNFSHSDKIQLEKGLRLEDGRTSPCKAKILEQNERQSKVEITIHEGRKRQVKRMFDALGYKVMDLHRSSIGFLTLQGLKEGEYRLLTNEEVSKMKELCKARKAKNVIPEYRRKSK